MTVESGVTREGVVAGSHSGGHHPMARPTVLGDVRARCPRRSELIRPAFANVSAQPRCTLVAANGLLAADMAVRLSREQPLSHYVAGGSLVFQVLLLTGLLELSAR
jgi:hypothetical protein